MYPIHEVITHAVNVAELIFLTGEVDAFQGFIGSQAKVIHLLVEMLRMLICT